MKIQTIVLTSLVLLFNSCIGDDLVFDTISERVSISNPIDSLQIDSSYQFEANFFNNIGEPSIMNIRWSSSDENIIQVESQGLAKGVALGVAIVKAEVELENNRIVEDQVTVVVSENQTVIVNPTERSGSIRTTSSYTLQGSFTLREESGQLILELGDDYKASSSLPGLYVYLTNNPNTINNAFEIGKVSTFSGTHTYEFTGPMLNEFDYLLYFCKPFGVKVGDGNIQ